MASGDIQPFESASTHSMGGAIKAYVASGTLASINAGEPVQKLAGAAGATQFPNNGPTATIRIMGVASSVSTDTTTTSGLVDVVLAAPGQIWMIAPKVAATWNTQAKYNALIGSRVLIDLTAGVYTLLASDSAGNGCIVEYLDIAKYPGMVAFSWSPLCDYRNV